KATVAAEPVAPTSAYDRDPSMITSDPPEHDRVRRAALRHFGPPHSPALGARQEPGIQPNFTSFFGKLKGKTRIDVVDEFAYPLPVTVICAILGVPRQDEPRFHGWIQAFMNGLDLGPEATSEEQQRLREMGNQGKQELKNYMGGLLERY